MLTLYKVRLRLRFHRVNGVGRGGHDLQGIIASERSQRAATARARAFAATHGYEPKALGLDSVESICSTPDDVLDWA